MKLNNKVAVVTGAGSGMGRAIAERFASEGAKVVVSDMNMETAEETVTSIVSADGIAIPVKADITEESDVERMIIAAIEHYGSLDILVNNAGMMDNMMPAGEITDDLWNKVLDVNVTGMMRTTRKALPIFLEKKAGVIINTASSASLRGSRAGLAYTASKHAVAGMTKNVGFQYAEEGIRCNAIAPGGVETNIGTTMSEPNAFGLERAMSATDNNPRTGKPEEVASIALFLASEDASFVNGDIITADAGLLAY
ncbi:SDR family oxidoreductase [Natribacillus halophilus]|uniref:NAD(P)-dependent dehydrogenase, short-chain alcohol dehydrogenase family n=1 Tax=Natribacillus halophilus TaxID=549003 RepID=A0A1G8MT34_9BACI|nr:SDR family oxidoreductase [Natribacillus halophilus]SDI71064.1 NAD(P)-dependent dehydrogenase, short-chain alcohol dehydrogenase family [Natribacillus halophilus]